MYPNDTTQGTSMEEEHSSNWIWLRRAYYKKPFRPAKLGYFSHSY